MTDLLSPSCFPGMFHFTSLQSYLIKAFFAFSLFLSSNLPSMFSRNVPERPISFLPCSFMTSFFALIRKRKKSYFSNKIFTDSSNKHHLWKSLKTVLQSRKYGDTMVKETSPDSFNKFFTSVCVDLTKTLQSDNLPSIKANPPSCSFDLSPMLILLLALLTSHLYLVLLCFML